MVSYKLKNNLIGHLQDNYWVITISFVYEAKFFEPPVCTFVCFEPLFLFTKVRPYVQKNYIFKQSIIWIYFSW